MELELYEPKRKRISGGWTDISIVKLSAPSHVLSALMHILKEEGRKSEEEIREKIGNYYNNSTKGYGLSEAGDFRMAFPTIQEFMDVVIPELESSEYVRKTNGFYEWVE